MKLTHYRKLGPDDIQTQIGAGGRGEFYGRRLLFFVLLPALAAAQTHQWGVWEKRFTADIDSAELVSPARVRGPGGAALEVDAFWDGGRQWVLRISPDQPGRWSYEFQDQRGAFRVLPSTAPGAVRVSSSRRTYLEHANGKPFFWLADTSWNGVIKATDEEWTRYAADRKAKGFTSVKFVMTQWRAAPDAKAFTPDPPLRVNPAFFRRMDRRFAELNAAGLVAMPVLLWAIASKTKVDPGYYLPNEQAIQLARYMVARYSAYQVIWILAGDGDYRGEKAEKWKQIGRAVFPEGRRRRPVTMHPGGMHWPWPELEDEPWLDIITYQSGHGNNEKSRAWNTVELAKLAAALRVVRPVINAEPNYETHLDYHERKPITDYQVRRAAYWSLLAHPTAGVSYGAHGIWFWSRAPEAPTAHERTGVAIPWWESLDLPGAKQMKVLRDLFDSIEWWRLRPDRSLLAEEPQDPAYLHYIAAARSEAGDLAILYLPDNPQVALRLDRLAATARAQWVDPRNGVRHEIGSLPNSGRRALTRPGEGDWVLLLEAKGEK